MEQKKLISVFDYSGRWAHPYKENGWLVIQIDIKLGIDVLNITEEHVSQILPVHGVLLAPPCTDFSVSGAQYWKQKDVDGRTEQSLRLVRQGLNIVKWANPDFWALENPVGRLPKLIPELGKPWYFQPYWYGDAYTKKTGLWGIFNKPYKTNEVEPVRVNSQGSWIQSLGGKSERTKELRSMTPLGFAYAFYNANH